MDGVRAHANTSAGRNEVKAAFADFVPQGPRRRGSEAKRFFFCNFEVFARGEILAATGLFDVVNFDFGGQLGVSV